MLYYYIRYSRLVVKRELGLKTNLKLITKTGAFIIPKIVFETHHCVHRYCVMRAVCFAVQMTILKNYYYDHDNKLLNTSIILSFSYTMQTMDNFLRHWMAINLFWPPAARSREKRIIDLILEFYWWKHHGPSSYRKRH